MKLVQADLMNRLRALLQLQLAPHRHVQQGRLWRVERHIGDEHCRIENAAQRRTRTEKVSKIRSHCDYKDVIEKCCRRSSGTSGSIMSRQISKAKRPA